MTIEEINTDRVKFLSHVSQSVETELKKVGLKLINVNITDICDETGYIEALGKAAAAKAINDAIISVSQEDRDGAIGQATAVQDQRVQVADLNAKATIGEANANQNERIHTADAEAKATIGEAEANKQGRVHVAEANAKSIEGENVFQIDIAESNASRRERQAEANKRATSSEMIQSAKALEEAYAAEKLAENARAIRKEAEQQADIIVPAQINKQKIEIEAEAQAERIRRIAKGEADAIFLRKEAEAKGLYQILTKQAECFDRIVKAAKNDPQDTELLLIADKLSELVKTQAEAIKNGIIWETDTRKFGDSAANSFISGMYKSVPPLDMFEAGMKLPNFLKEGGVKKDRAEITTPEVLPKKDLSTASEQVAKSNSTTNKK
jgi:flotillin